MLREVVLGLLLFYFVKPLLSSIAFATVLAVALNPVYSVFRRRLFAIFLIAVSIGTIGYLSYSVAGTLVDQVNALVDLYNRLSPEEQTNLLQLSSNLPLKDFAISVARSLPSIVVQFLFFLLFSYFFLVDGWRLRGAIATYLPKGKAEKLIEEGWENLRSIVMGVFVSMAFYFIFSFSVLKFTGVPSPLVYSFLATLFSVLPLVGAWMVYAFPLYEQYLAGNYVSIAAVVAFQLAWMLLLDPFFKMRYRGTLHPAVLLGSMTAGIYYFGFSGIVIGPLFITALKTLAEVERYFLEPVEVKEEY